MRYIHIKIEKLILILATFIFQDVKMLKFVPANTCLLLGRPGITAISQLIYILCIYKHFQNCKQEGSWTFSLQLLTKRYRRIDLGEYSMGLTRGTNLDVFIHVSKFNWNVYNDIYVIYIIYVTVKIPFHSCINYKNSQLTTVTPKWWQKLIWHFK